MTRVVRPATHSCENNATNGEKSPGCDNGMPSVSANALHVVLQLPAQLNETCRRDATQKTNKKEREREKESGRER